MTLIAAAVVTLIGGFAAAVLYAPRAFDLWRGGLDTSDEFQRFWAACLVTVCGACAVVTSINAMVR